jgi:Family of unknown function (DUF5682)
MPDTVHIFGIRHHGPGSAHSLKQALTALQPDIVLIEGPPDADALIAIAEQTSMKPPVALLVYATDQPQQAAYFPFAEFSPEWQAIQYALANNIAVQFMDLPQAYQLQATPATQTISEENLTEQPLTEEPLTEEHIHYGDPLEWLAQAAGDSDTERWWERLVEQRQDSTDLFQGIIEAMQALREELPDLRNSLHEQQREAFMRTTIRNAQKTGFTTIAVVCGAWHAPALATMPPAKQDQALLKGLSKTKVSATWIPWTQGRLALRTGYGAGIESPGWYQHLWHCYSRQSRHCTAPKPDANPDAKSLISTRWLTHVARLLRKQGMDASSASIIETVRLAECLAALRQYPLPGLTELNEATQTVLCFGDELPMRVIHEQLIINDRLGQVPSDTPMVPLQQDLHRWQKRLRLKSEPAAKDLVLDLRQETDLLRSQLLHRLNLLGIPWGKPQITRSKGTFKEGWQIAWQPTFEVALIEKGTWGNTIELAATHFLNHLAQTAENLPVLTNLLDSALLSDLSNTVPVLMQRIQTEAAIAQDISHLMAALPPLAQVMRYGNVRDFNTQTLHPIVQGLVTRICISLPLACTNLDEDAAAQMDTHLLATHQAIGLLQIPEFTAPWQNALQQLAHPNTLSGLIAGRCCRLLLDAGVLNAETVAQRLSLALSVANDPTQSAAWISGLLKGSGLLLLHNSALLQMIDNWLCQLLPEVFLTVLPLLRRTFADFPAAERRQMGQQVQQRFDATQTHLTPELDLNHERANLVLPILETLLLQPS